MGSIDGAITGVFRLKLYPQIEILLSVLARTKIGQEIDKLPRYTNFSESIRDMGWQLEKN